MTRPHRKQVVTARPTPAAIGTQGTAWDQTVQMHSWPRWLSMPLTRRWLADLAHTQSAVIAQFEHHAMFGVLAGGQDSPNLVAGQQLRNPLRFLGYGERYIKRRPLQHMQVQEPYAVQIDAATGGGQTTRLNPQVIKEVL